MSALTKRLSAILCVLVLLFVTATINAESQYRLLKKGDSGEDILALKQRMYYLGYFTNLKNLTAKYNDVMAQRICLLQKNNGLEETGEATPELQELIFSDRCVWVEPTPKPTPVPTPTPTPIGPQYEPDLPELDAEGFLPDKNSTPFVLEDREDGHWIYISHDISVDIQRMTDKRIPLIWFESRVRSRDSARLRRLLAKKEGKVPGHSFMMPQSILNSYDNVIFACSDDFFGYRWKYNQTQGIIISDGEILSAKTFKKVSQSWPQLDVLAIFEDGTAKAFCCNAHTAEEYINMNVTDTFAFGPILVQDGKISDDVFTYPYAKTRIAPRTAIGNIGPGDFLILTVTGRRKDTKGATIMWLAEKMIEKGVTEALNLDGGNTCSLFFNGKLLNRPELVQDKDIRKVTGLIGIMEEE